MEGCVYGDATERRSSFALASFRLRALRYGRQDGGQVEEIKRLDALLEYAVMHDDEAEAARLRAELTKLVDKV